MTSIGGFGKGGRDVRIASLKCNDVQILDKDCNLFVPRTGTFAELQASSLETKGNLVVCGNLTGVDGEITIEGNLIVQGNTFSASDEFTRIFEFNGNANVCIPPPQEMSCVEVVEQPCLGFVESVDSETGNMLYLPAGEPPAFDVFQYRAKDACGVPHLLTQLVCQRITPVPPFLNNSGNVVVQSGDSNSPLDFNLNTVLVEGTSPIDWSTLDISEFTIHVVPFGTSSYTLATSCMIPYGTLDPAVSAMSLMQISPTTWTAIGTGAQTGRTLEFTVSHNGAGLLTFNWVELNFGTFESIEVYYRVLVSVQDAASQASNMTTVQLLPPVSAVMGSYVRFYADSSHTLPVPNRGWDNGSFGLGEIEVYGDEQMLMVTATSGTIVVGSRLTGGGVLESSDKSYVGPYYTAAGYGTFITEQISGTPGGVGIYKLSEHQTGPVTPTTCDPSRLIAPAPTAWSTSGISEGYTEITPSVSNSPWITHYYICHRASGGVTFRTTDFTAIAPWTGSVTITFRWTGLHSFFINRQYLQYLTGGGSVLLVDQTDQVGFIAGGIADIGPPFGNEFAYQGTVTFSVTSGQPFGFRMGGSNFDGTSLVCGQFTITGMSTPSSVAPFAITSQIIGGGFIDFATTAAGATATSPFPNMSVTGFSPSNVIDGCPAQIFYGANGHPSESYWRVQDSILVGVLSTTIDIDLGQFRSIRLIKIRNGGSTNAPGTNAFRVGVSTDGVNFTIVGGGNLPRFDPRSCTSVMITP